MKLLDYAEAKSVRWTQFSLNTTILLAAVPVLNTIYLIHYDRCDHSPSREEVRDAMVRLAAIVGQGVKFSSSTFDILVMRDKVVEHLYTSEQLRSSTPSSTSSYTGSVTAKVMDAVMPFIRLMNKRIVSNPYRQPQRKVADFQAKDNKKRLKPSGSVRLPGFLSTTLRENFDNFAGNARLIIRVFQQCPITLTNLQLFHLKPRFSSHPTLPSSLGRLKCKMESCMYGWMPLTMQVCLKILTASWLTSNKRLIAIYSVIIIH